MSTTSSQLTQLPMIECSSCGKQVGHLYEDYQQFTRNLLKDIEQNGMPPALNDDYVTTGEEEPRDIKPYLETYYNWCAANGATPFNANNIIIRALLGLVPLEDSAIPYSIEEDGQRGYYEVKICCMTMLMTDPSSQ